MKKVARITNEGKIKLSFSSALFIYSAIVVLLGGAKFALPAMICSAIGDIYIMASRGVFLDRNTTKNDFSEGVFSFACAHVAYIIAMPTEKSEYCFKIALICTIILAIFKINSKIANSKMFCVPYAVCLIASVVNSYEYGTLAAIGGTLFLLSDGILALFEEKGPKWQITIWATYVPAQICLLTAILLG